MSERTAVQDPMLRYADAIGRRCGCLRRQNRRAGTGERAAGGDAGRVMVMIPDVHGLLAHE
jgi:hypothetical protein